MLQHRRLCRWPRMFAPASKLMCSAVELLRDARRAISASVHLSARAWCFSLMFLAVVLPAFRPGVFSYSLSFVTVFFTYVPLKWTPSAVKLRRLILQDCADYFPVNVKFENLSAFESEKAYVYGFAPHSAVPLALPVIFNSESRLLPEKLRNVRTAATSLMFRLPFIRQLWAWMEVCPVSRSSLWSLLESGTSVAFSPGGVREIEVLRPGIDVLFLRQRYGFVKLAIQTGSPLVPVFAFGQSQTCGYLTFGPLRNALCSLGRAIGALPAPLVGKWYTTIPHKVPLLVVIGSPIPVPHMANPDNKTVQQYLDKFIDRIQDLFEQHKAEAGTPDLKLQVL